MPFDALTTTHPPAIACRNLSLRFGPQTQVLSNLSLEIASGQIVTLLGPSGCGKSTLLKLIAKLLQPQDGSISIDRGPTTKQSPRVSFVFQEPTLLPWRSVLSNVRLPLEIDRSLRRHVSKGDILNLLATVGLQPQDSRKFPSQLSGGMKMRTSLARALITDPDILLLDEPFAALDDILRTRLNELLVQLWTERHRTIVFVTHNIAEAIFLSHRVAIMSRGRIAEEIPIDLPFPRTRLMRSLPAFAKVFGFVSERLEAASR